MVFMVLAYESKVMPLRNPPPFNMVAPAPVLEDLIAFEHIRTGIAAPSAHRTLATGGKSVSICACEIAYSDNSLGSPPLRSMTLLGIR